MSDLPIPTIGRQVHYRGKDGRHRAAIVTDTHGPLCVNLFVFGRDNADTEAGIHTSVTHAQPEQEAGCFPSWAWPPFVFAQQKPLPTESEQIAERERCEIDLLKSEAEVNRARAASYLAQPEPRTEDPPGAAALFIGTGQLVNEELARAVTKFPTWPTDPLHALAVLGEEFGELSKAMLQQVYEPHKNTADAVRKEAVQTAAMALRLLASLDTYRYAACPQHHQPLHRFQATPS